MMMINRTQASDLHGPPIPFSKAAEALSTKAIRDGYQPAGLHIYRDAQGAFWFARIRCKHPNGQKWIRPVRREGLGYVIGEPADIAACKPLYRLDAITSADLKTWVFFVEGENCADQLAEIGLLATTAGSAASDDKADFAPLAGRSVTLWPDNDLAGKEHMARVAAKLVAIDCNVLIVDVDALALPAKGDAVDWLAAHAEASAADVAGLPKIEGAAAVGAEVRGVAQAPGTDHVVKTDVEDIVQAAEAGDVGAPFEPAALAALRDLRARDHAGWARLRARLKAAGVGVTELDRHLHNHGGTGHEDEGSVADKLIFMARARCQLLHDGLREPYAVFEAAGARQVHRVQSDSFRDYLSHAYYTEYDRAPNDQAVKVALATLRGQAQFEGDSCEAFVRIAKTDSGYWLDLCNDAWECVHVTSTGWSVVAGAGAPLFTRSPSMQPLPVPERGGTLDALWPLVNIPAADRPLVLAWLLECVRPETPHVVLELVGEQGSAKSATQRVLRRLIDPNHADLRPAPKSVEDVWIAARNSHMVSLENLSHLPPQYQDALCVLATGGGYSARTLYTNAEETIIDLRKPIALNGISVIVTAQDLLDRCLHVDLPVIQKRELASELEARFKAAQPALVGALLDLFVKVLATLPAVSIPPEQRPRMADFAVLGEAVFRVLGEPPGTFLAQYGAMREDGVRRTIDASPVGAAVVAYLADSPDG
ncbi:MAG: hypothetical protein K2W80_04225, partial [Burkholderiales bacterium]|nr:hypothetical protein [Burkholderiales bacterium]